MIVRGVLWDFIGRMAQIAVTFIISLFLARLLVPEDFGLVGLVIAIFAVAQVFADLGLGAALTQTKEIDDDLLSSVFWVNQLAAFVLVALLFLSAPMISGFYNEPDLVLVLRVLCLNLLINNLGSIHRVKFQREMNFGLLTRVQLVGVVISGIVAVVMAFQGFGVWSLVTQYLMVQLISTTLIWIISKWTPKRVLRWDRVKSLFGFGVYQLFNQLLKHFFAQLDVFVVGKIYSSATLGLYSRAKTLNDMVVMVSSESLSRVTFPYISKHQDDPNRIRGFLQKATELVGFGACLLSGCLYFLAPWLIPFLFGDQWEPSIAYFQILVLGGFALPLASIFLGALIGLGGIKEHFHLANISRVLLLGAAASAWLISLEAFLWSLVGANILSMVINLLGLRYRYQGSLWPTGKLLIRFIGSAIGVGLLIFSLQSSLGISAYGAELVYGVAFCVVYLGVSVSLGLKVGPTIKLIRQNLRQK